MVSRLYRHLSLLLVMVIVTSWFVLPESLQPYAPSGVGRVQAQAVLLDPGIGGASGSSSASTSIASNTSFEVAEETDKLLQGYQFAYFNNSNKPTSIEFSWNQPNSTSMVQPYTTPWPFFSQYRIEYIPTSVASTMNKTICTQQTGWTALQPTTILEANEQKTRTVRTIDNARSQITSPSYFRLLVTFRQVPANPPAVLACGATAISPYNSNSTSVGLSAGGVLAPDQSKRNIQTYFGSITNSATTSLTKSYTNGPTTSTAANNGDVDLLDDPKDKTGDTNNDTFPDPTLPPILKINKAKLAGMTSDLELKLVSVITAPELIKARQNNYFLFLPNNLTANQKQVFQANGIDPTLLYVTIDVGGNIGILFDDKTKNGGIFANGKDRFDTGSTTNLIELGSFDGSSAVSKNPNNQPLIINSEQYKTIITKRVYNEGKTRIDIRTIDPVECTNVINYPDLNKVYDEETEGRPIGAYRKCINVSTGGWLSKWNVSIDRMEQSGGEKDPCEEAFSKGLFNSLQIIGRVICGVTHAAIFAATWFATFSVNFLLSAIDVQ